MCSLDRISYGPVERVNVHMQLENSSAVDVAGTTIKVKIAIIPLCILTDWFQVIRVIKLYGLDKAREEEELSAHTVYDTLFEIFHTGCPKNSNEKR